MNITDDYKIILEQHLKSYPKMSAPDGVKLLYQHSFGAKHLIEDEKMLIGQLMAERDSAPEESNSPDVFENIGNSRLRVHLNSMSDAEIRALAKAFLKGMKPEICDYERKIFNNGLDYLETVFPEENAFFEDYRGKGCPPVRHSQTFRDEYHPAYRVIEESWANIITAVSMIDKLIQGRLSQCKPQNRSFVVLLEGRCASGKTTLSELLGEIYDAPVIHADDFFLPFERKTAERMAEPGGNIDYERFREEITDSLSGGETVKFRKFSCSTGTLGEYITLPESEIYIVEGAYSLHPYYGWNPDIKIFVDIDPELQKERILKRNGEEMLKRFESMWIPMEEKYFETFNMESKADIVLRLHS